VDENIQIVLDGMHREGSYHNQYYTWSKEFLEADRRQMKGENAVS
jgi:hypothetical protein